MRRLGILGGMSWESTVEYYRLINEGVRARLGGLHSAELVLASVDFAPVGALQHAGDWVALGRLLGDLAARLVGSGAEGLLIAANTMHIVADEVAGRAGRPLLHIGDAAGRAVARAGCRKVALLGTRFTMTERFYAERIEGLAACDVVIPNQAERDAVHTIIYDELCRGEIRDASRDAVLAMLDRMRREDEIDAALLACTELPLLVAAGPVPLFDTMRLHCEAAVDWMLGGAAGVSG